MSAEIEELQKRMEAAAEALDFEEARRLRDRLKQQEAATARVQEMFEAVEKRLESADTGLSTLVFYHLRALWSDGREIIGLLVQDLAAKQEERARKAFALEGNRKQFQQRQTSEQQLRQAESHMVAARQQLVAFDGRLAKLDKWWHRWERPKVARQRPALQTAVEAAEQNLFAARARCEQIEKAGAGEFPGISVEARRSINLAAIACAEVLCLRLARTSLVASARAAMSRREPTEYYGDVPACVSIMSDIVKARNLVKQRNGIMQEVAQRVERLRSSAAYLGEFETVPIPESCGVAEGDVLAHGSQGVTAAKLPNVVAQDTWDLFKVLLR
jgi:hypothetical protein